MPLSPRPLDAAPASLEERLSWAASVTSRYGGPGSQGSGEPVFAHLPELVDALEQVCREGTPAEVAAALPLADVLGAAWERLGEQERGRARLDALLAAANRAGLREELPVARVLRRRARLAIAGRRDDEADEDLQRAYGIAAGRDERLTASVVLDRADLAMHRGAWDTAAEVMPELLHRVESTGDPLLHAMGLNRAGWGAFGRGDHLRSREHYEQAWSLAELHEDPLVEARTAAGLAVLGMLGGDVEGGRAFWRRALELAEQLHDRAFTLHCLDGIAALLVLSEREEDGGRLSSAVSSAREVLQHPRSHGMLPLHDLVGRRASAPFEPWTYADAVAFARAAVSATA